MKMLPSIFQGNKKVILLLLSCLLSANTVFSQQHPNPASEYFTVENYYRIKWGYSAEFIGLWKANHYPLLKKALEKGDIISISASTPRYHSGEDTRWDYRVTIVFRIAALAFDENLTEPYKKQLYPDQETYIKAEQHRFELLLSHWDVMTKNESLN